MRRRFLSSIFGGAMEGGVLGERTFTTRPCHEKSGRYNVPVETAGGRAGEI
jgi:hypothetical protein